MNQHVFPFHYNILGNWIQIRRQRRKSSFEWRNESLLNEKEGSMLKERRTVSLSGSLLLTNVWGFERNEVDHIKDEGDYVRKNTKEQGLKEIK